MRFLYKSTETHTRANTQRLAETKQVCDRDRTLSQVFLVQANAVSPVQGEHVTGEQRSLQDAELISIPEKVTHLFL